MVFSASMPLWRHFGPNDHAIPPIYSVVPKFSLTNQDGQPFGSEELYGHAFVANFVFLGCSDACPRLTEKMRQLQDELTGTRVRLVTFSVDPVNDTPERLKDYGRAFGADFARWTFLTGPSAEIERTVVRGFKIAMGKEPASNENGETKSGILQIFHGERFVLVDGACRIRGYFDSDAASLTELVRAARTLSR